MQGAPGPCGSTVPCTDARATPSGEGSATAPPGGWPRVSLQVRREQRADGRYLVLYRVHGPSTAAELGREVQQAGPEPAGVAPAGPPAAGDHRGELRWHPLLGQWVVVAAHRQERTYKPPAEYCPLCPTRDPNQPTEIPDEPFDVAVFENRFPALVRTPPVPGAPAGRLWPVRPARGVCEVVVYSPDHERSLGEQPLEQIRALVEVWAERYRELGAHPFVRYVMIFENRGDAVGVTLHHPHGQIYAFPFVPPIPRRELVRSRRHLQRTGRCLLCDVLAHELTGPEDRTVVRGEGFVAFVPFFARFPFETMVAPLQHVASLEELTSDGRWQLASVLKPLLVAYDALFGFKLPYMMVMHQAPTDRPAGGYPECHFHLEFLPLQRSASRLKYLAGSESGAGTFITDMTPEEMAERLRKVLASLRETEAT